MRPVLKTKAAPTQVKTGKTEVGEKENSGKMRNFMQGFNVNSVLLLVAIVLLGMLVGRDNEVEVVKFQRNKGQWPLEVVSVPDVNNSPDYVYGAVHVTREKLERAQKFEPSWQDVREVLAIPMYWEYVGPLCHDGINGAWLLVRKRKTLKESRG